MRNVGFMFPFIAALCWCWSAGAEPVAIQGLVTIQASVREAPPDWAVKQRHLFRTIEEAAPLYLAKYTYRGGTMRESRKIDDDYENFISWPLFYIMGGDERIFDWGLKEFNAITRQWTYDRGKSVYQEFVGQYDMLHLTEGYVGFQYFGLADPTIPENIDRARRFADYYVRGGGLESPNYDPEHRVMRSIVTGSMGASDTAGVTFFHASLYPFVKTYDPGWDKDPARREEIQRWYDRAVVQCDVPANLAITGLVTHAYLLTGDEAYRTWVLDYAGAWIDRISENNGIIPDNVGRSGIIGENRDGQWWGGFFGWNTRYSLEIMFNALITATECAYLLSGDEHYLTLLRSQADVLLSQAKTVDGDLLIPYKYGPEGWFDFRPMEPYILSHLWHASLADEDWNRIERIRKGRKHGPWAYTYTTSPDPSHPEREFWRSDGTSFDWNKILDDLAENKFRRNESPHLGYLGGINPDWPDRILDAEYALTARNVERIQAGTYKHEWDAHTIHAQNPVVTSGLAQMTMGAPYTCFNGGLLRGEVRYFDRDLARPGLPADVAALVEKLRASRIVLHLVNTGAFDTRHVIIQAGTYREHQFVEATYTVMEKTATGETLRSQKTVSVNSPWLAVELPPSTTITLELGTRRFVNRPTYAFPWQQQ